MRRWRVTWRGYERGLGPSGCQTWARSALHGLLRIRREMRQDPSVRRGFVFSGRAALIVQRDQVTGLRARDDGGFRVAFNWEWEG